MNKFIAKLFFVALLFLFFVSAQGADFSINPPVIKAFIQEGSDIDYSINIVNLEREQRFDIDYSSRLDFISVDKSSLIVREEDVGVFNVVLNGKQPGVYVGNIVITGESDSIIVPAVLEVESKEVLFDVRAKMAPKYFEINPGKLYVVDISIFNIGASDENVELEYYISDINGNIIISEKESFADRDRLSIRKSFMIPEDAEKGDYLFYVYAKQGNSLGTSSLLFYVGEYLSLSPRFDFVFNYYLYYIGGVIIVLLIAIFIFNYFVNKRLLRVIGWKKGIFGIKRMEFGVVNQRINRIIRQKNLLKKAYEKGYIRKGSYNEGKKNANELVKHLKKLL